MTIELLRFLADRVSLSVGRELALGHDNQPSELVIVVGNLGRRATTITDAGWFHRGAR